MLRKLALWTLISLGWNVAVAQTVTTLYSFNGSDDSFELSDHLMQASDGNLYGLTNFGGEFGHGSIFRVSISGEFDTVYNFTGGNDGAYPYSQLVEGPDGSLYGSTYAGGDTSLCTTTSGCGTIFRITLDGSLTTLYSFRGGSDGSLPWSGLTLGNDGNFYGATYAGGDAAPGPYASGDGTIFRISPSGTYSQLYALNGPTDGQWPAAVLLQAIDGNFYGTTSSGGANNEGTIFRITPSGEFTVVHAFTGSDGAYPAAHLAETASGALAGAAWNGGDLTKCDSRGCGTLFSLTPAGNFSLLYTFEDGSLPWGELFPASDGLLYGITAGSPSCNGSTLIDCQAIYSVAPDGSSFTAIYSFNGSLEEVGANGGLLQGSDGNFYGTTTVPTDIYQDGTGTIYKLSYSPSKSAPVVMAFDQSQVPANTPVHLTWSVLNGFSATMQQCYASIEGSPQGAGTWAGKQTQTGTLSPVYYSGSATITPTEDGIYVYALTCGGIETGFATLTVGGSAAPPPLGIATTSLPSGTVGVPYSATLAATGGASPYTWSTSGGNLPAGLTLNSSSGVISGTPTASGTANFTAVVEDTESTPQTASAALSITVNAAPAPPSLTANPTTLSVTDPGVSGLSTLTTTNFNTAGAAIQFSCTGLPAGATCFFSQLTVPTPPDTGYTTLQIAMDEGEPASLSSRRTPARFSALYALALPWLLLPAAAIKRRKWWLVAAALLLGTLAMNGCYHLNVRGSSQNTYPVTVTATAGAQTASTTIQLVVSRQ